MNDVITAANLEKNGKNKKASLHEMDLEKATPAMKQYILIKKKYPDSLLFYRMGDFYELFFEDAVTASDALGLTLTSRSKTEGKDIPMCGVPFHAYDLYLARLIKMGFKVAICEQTEDPKKAKQERGSTAIVNRDVTRVVTPGTITEENLLDAKRSNYIACVYIRARTISISWIDISTGAFYIEQQPIDKVPAQIVLSTSLARLAPVEILIEDRLLGLSDFYSILSEYKDKLSPRPRALFNLDSATNTLHTAYKIETMESFGDFSKDELIAAGVLLEYIQNTQKGTMPRLEMPKQLKNNEILEIDAATRRSLELLTPNSSGSISLLKVIDKTVTGAGGRMLAERLAAPLTNPEKINERLDAVSFFLDNPSSRQQLRQIMRRCPDMKRAVQRLSMNRGGPRDLYDLAAALHLVPAIQEAVLHFAKFQPDSIYSEAPAALRKLAETFFDHSLLETEISNMLLDDRDSLPALARNGGFIKRGANSHLDYLRDIREDSDKKCAELIAKYNYETGVPNLKIKNNSVIGYFVEVSAKSAGPLFENKSFIHRQTVTNAVRFTTQELSELEDIVNSSLEKAMQTEMDLYNELVAQVLAQADMICRTAEKIARLDVSAALAELAAEYDYCRPVVDDSLDFEITEGRHPVVENVIKREGDGCFVGNNCVLNHETDRVWLLTGPNMAGKSTFLRQNALIAILAQMGSFVPAQKAKIGIIDKVFSRVGASDDLARGRSTFMVEMVETAAILNRAGERSFVILDEIGRGTATFDGLSIAWAVVEQLSEINKCRTIFATHYHELTKLYKRLDGLSLHCMKITEFNGEIVLLHEVANGAADRSYGIHVAKLAGLPNLTIKRAEQVLATLEEEKQNKILSAVEYDLPLFSSLKETVRREEQTVSHASAAENALAELDVDSLSPREALSKLYELKELLANNH